MTILLGYRRKSVVRDPSDLVSPEQQAHGCEQWIQLYLPGASIEWYEDVDRSGRTEEGRPGWQLLLRQVERPEVSGVIAWSLDRLHRNVRQFLAFLDTLERLDKRLVTVKENLDTSSAVGRAVVTILMAIAQLESDQTSERMKTAVKYRREVQGRHWGPTPFGCDRDDKGMLIPSQKRYWLNTVTGEVTEKEPAGDQWQARKYYDALDEMYQVYAEGGIGYGRLAEILNAGGWRFLDRSSQPRLFDKDDTRRAVAAWRLFGGELPTGKLVRQNGRVLVGHHQPILPIELCRRVGQVHAGRTRQVSRIRATEQVYILTPVLFCAACGRKLNGMPSGYRGKRMYRHQGAVGTCPERQTSADDLEAEVLDKLIALGDSGLIEQVRDEALRLAQEAFSQNDDRGILAELNRQRERLDKLEELYLDGGIERARYNSRLAEVLEAISGLENELYTASQMPDFDQAIRRMTATLDSLAAAEPETQKSLIYSLFERIDVAGGRVANYIPRPWAAGFF